MSENPFEPPRDTSPAVGVLSGQREDLRTIARFQKGILVCILIYLIAVIAQFALPPELRIFMAVGVMVFALAGAVFVFLLAIKVYGVGLGILLGVLSMAPCLGLIVLFLVNGKATNVLRQNGIKVGLMGANISSI
jgi:hypothetical protein